MIDQVFQWVFQIVSRTWPLVVYQAFSWKLYVHIFVQSPHRWRLSHLGALEMLCCYVVSLKLRFTFLDTSNNSHWGHDSITHLNIDEFLSVNPDPDIEETSANNTSIANLILKLKLFLNIHKSVKQEGRGRVYHWGESTGVDAIHNTHSSNFPNRLFLTGYEYFTILIGIF